MKRVLISCLILFLFIIDSNYLRAQSLKDGLIAYWSFDDGTANDFSGNNFHGTIVNNPKPYKGMNGRGHALYFNGKGDHITKSFTTNQYYYPAIGDFVLIPRIPFENYSDFTVSMWVKEDYISYFHGEAYIFFGDQTAGYLSIDHAYYEPDTTRYINFAVGSVLGKIKTLRDTFNYKKDRGVWNFYLLKYRNGEMFAYKNSKLVGAKKQEVSIFNSNAGIACHYWYRDSVMSARFSGAIDEVRIYNRALSDSEIVKLYLCGDSLALCKNHSIVIKAPDGFTSYKWSSGESTQSISVDNIGDYRVTVTDSNGTMVESDPYSVYFIDNTLSDLDSLFIDYNGFNPKSKAYRTIKNTGTDTIIIQDLSLSKKNKYFKLSSNRNFPTNLLPNDSLELTVEFLQNNEQVNENEIYIYVNEPCSGFITIPIKTRRINCQGSNFSMTSFTNIDNLSIKGSTFHSSGYLRLTPTAVNKVGVVWNKTQVPVKNGFTSVFSFRISDGVNDKLGDKSIPGADGLAFVIQNTNIDEIGFPGGRIGYDPIPNSLVIEYDLFTNDSTQIEDLGDPNGNHIAVMSNGTNNNTADHLKGSTIAINDKILLLESNKVFWSKIEYYNNQLRVYLDTTDKFTSPVITINQLSLNTLLNLANGEYAFIGFTSATGTSYENHDLLSWEFCSEPPDRPLSIEDREYSDNVYSVFPNPSNLKNTLQISIKYDCFLEIALYDIFGKEIKTVHSGMIPTGDYKFFNEDLDLSSGIYIFRITEGTKIKNIPFVINK